MATKTSEISAPTPREPLEIRKARRAEEAISAMAEYEQDQRATLAKTEKLRAARLARQPGLRGPDKQQDRQRDDRQGAYDPVKGPGSLPEGLKRKRKGQLSKTRGRG